MIHQFGLLLPESVLQTHWFNVLAAFVAINTLIYVVLSISKLFPVVHFRRPRGRRRPRSETRSIYPDAPTDGILRP